jgi:hyaluronan synthase
MGLRASLRRSWPSVAVLTLLRRLLVIVAFAVILLWHQRAEFLAPAIMFGGVSGVLLLILALASRAQPWEHAVPPVGRVVAVVPVFNEPEENLRRCVESLLNQTHPLDVIYVVDDGSQIPAVIYQHPKVHWTRTKNRGKREAQITGLGDEIHRADFIVTVDSDSVVAPDGVFKLLRTFSDPRTMAATGLPTLINRTQNLITRITDLELCYGSFTIRRAKSSLGAVCPTAGTLAVYRAAVFADNVDDYLSSGTFSDDRRLSHYALLKGRVISVDEAVVETQMPSTPSAVFRQRVRWFKGAWKYLPWEIGNLRGVPLYFRIWNTAMFVAYPAIIAHGFLVMPLLGNRIDWTPLIYWLSLLYVQTFSYVVGRPGMSVGVRLATWLFLTPLLSLFQLFLIRPAMYFAASQVRNQGWVTRKTKPVPRRALVPEEDLEIVRLPAVVCDPGARI